MTTYIAAVTLEEILSASGWPEVDVFVRDHNGEIGRHVVCHVLKGVTFGDSAARIYQAADDALRRHWSVGRWQQAGGAAYATAERRRCSTKPWPRS